MFTFMTAIYKHMTRPLPSHSSLKAERAAAPFELLHSKLNKGCVEGEVQGKTRPATASHPRRDAFCLISL